ncbi:MAG: M6 family metalloprotease domain-containing protein [Candidatus Binatia bacterium]
MRRAAWGALIHVALLGGWAPPARAREVPRRGELRLLVVLAGFPDLALSRPRAEFVGDPNALVDRLVAYYTEVSAGRLRIVPHVGEAVVTLPRPRLAYVQRPDGLAADAVAAFAKAATAAADRDALAAADAVLVFFAGTGKESHATGPDMTDPWSNYTEVRPAALGFDEACVVAEREREVEGKAIEPFGVLCHEFGHLLGLPELYATGGRPHEGIGLWGLMGHGTWVDLGRTPPHLEAWSKLRLGWVDAQVVEETTRRVELPAVEETPTVVKIAAVPGRPQEYYLLENRQRIGFDARLKGEGLLVWHVDEGVTGDRTAQNAPEHKLLHLVEADGRGDLDRGHAHGGNRGDEGDPWRGPPPWRRRLGNGFGLAGAGLIGLALYRITSPRALWPVLLRGSVAAVALAAASILRQGPVCGPGTPGMAPYGGEPVRIVIRNIAPSGRHMTVDILVAPRGPGG